MLAQIWATGRTWWQVPPVTRVTLKGRLPPGATGKDVIIALCGLFNKDEVLNDCIEFAGDGVATLDVDNRLTIASAELTSTQTQTQTHTDTNTLHGHRQIQSQTTPASSHSPQT